MAEHIDLRRKEKKCVEVGSILMVAFFCVWKCIENVISATISVRIRAWLCIYVVLTQFHVNTVLTYAVGDSIFETMPSFFLPWHNNPSGPKSPHWRGFTTTLRHTTVGRTPLDEWSARLRDLYRTTHNTHMWQTSIPPVGFEPTMPVTKRPQTHVLDHWNRQNMPSGG